MNAPRIPLAIACVIVLAGVGYGAYWYGMSRGMQMTAGAAPEAATSGALKAGDVDPSNGRKILYWHDPMVPGQKFDRPGKSPFMDMQLVPVYAEGGGEGTVSISPRVQQNLGVRTAEVRRGTLSTTVEAVGSVAYNERDLVMVQARSNGFLEKLYVRATLDRVRRGQPLAELYVPDWIAAQEEYLSARRIASQTEVTGLKSLVEGARQRMRLAGMTQEQIAAVEQSGKVHPRATITAPIGGVVAELAAREGMTVMAGAPLFRINGLATVWVNAEVPEAMAAQVRPGATVEARTSAFPGATFKGRVSAILPQVDPGTRTLKARIDVDNPEGKLVPGMFATVSFTPASRNEALLVPTEAVIATGRRTVVMVAQGDGTFAPVDVRTGLESNGQTEIRQGLKEGQKVVVSGQFLIDSEASLKATASRMDAPASDTAVVPVPTGTQSPAPAGTRSPSSSAPASSYRTTGVVEQVSGDEITISHEPVPALQWPAMTMGFKLPSGGGPKAAPGTRVEFEFRQGKSGYEITRIEPAAPSAGKASSK